LRREARRRRPVPAQHLRMRALRHQLGLRVRRVPLQLGPRARASGLELRRGARPPAAASSICGSELAPPRKLELWRGNSRRRRPVPARHLRVRASPAAPRLRLQARRRPRGQQRPSSRRPQGQQQQRPALRPRALKSEQELILMIHSLGRTCRFRSNVTVVVCIGAVPIGSTWQSTRPRRAPDSADP
jgi:hypothetical protein